jgi:hypothetical protein
VCSVVLNTGAAAAHRIAVEQTSTEGVLSNGAPNVVASEIRVATDAVALAVGVGIRRISSARALR